MSNTTQHAKEIFDLAMQPINKGLQSNYLIEQAFEILKAKGIKDENAYIQLGTTEVNVGEIQKRNFAKAAENLVDFVINYVTTPNEKYFLLHMSGIFLKEGNVPEQDQLWRVVSRLPESFVELSIENYVYQARMHLSAITTRYTGETIDAQSYQAVDEGNMFGTTISTKGNGDYVAPSHEQNVAFLHTFMTAFRIAGLETDEQLASVNFSKDEFKTLLNNLWFLTASEKSQSFEKSFSLLRAPISDFTLKMLESQLEGIDTCLRNASIDPETVPFAQKSKSSFERLTNKTSSSAKPQR